MNYFYTIKSFGNCIFRGRTATKKRSPKGPLRVSLSGDYLRSLRRRTIARAPRPSRLIVAGSGTAEEGL